MHPPGCHSDKGTTERETEEKVGKKREKERDGEMERVYLADVELLLLEVLFLFDQELLVLLLDH